MKNKILDKKVKPSPGSGLYRTLIAVEVLSNEPIDELAELHEVADQIVNGGFSGVFEIIETTEVSRKDMTKLLNEQDSDPSFLLGEDENTEEKDE